MLDVNLVLAARVSSCLRELVRIARSPRRIHAADGTVLGPLVRITMVSPSSGWGGHLECPVLRELVRVLLSKLPVIEGGGSVQVLGGSCEDNWSVQLLDESLVLITRVSSCSRTLVQITNCLRPGALGPGISGWKIRVVSCSVHEVILC